VIWTNKKGVALILVISSISMLSMMMVEFTFNSQINFKISKNFQNSLKAQALARSGVYFAMLELKVHKMIKDNPIVKQIPGFNAGMLDMIWQFGFIYPPIASKKATFGTGKEIEELTQKSKIDGKITAQIFDEGSKINLNDLENIQTRPAVIQQLDTIFEQKKASDEEFFRKYRDLRFTDLINNIVDWIDKDRDRVGGGDEESYYGRLPIHYQSKNTPLDTVSELALIEGFDDETIFDLLLPHITVYPTGGINVNTADSIVLLSLSPDFTEDDVKKLIEDRQKMGSFKDKNAFIKYCEEKLFKKIDPKLNLKTDSTIYSIESTGEVGGTSQMAHVVVDTSKTGADGAPQIVYWNMN